MNLHEYQAKELLAGYGLPVQGGILENKGEKTAGGAFQTQRRFQSSAGTDTL